MRLQAIASTLRNKCCIFADLNNYCLFRSRDIPRTKKQQSNAGPARRCRRRSRVMAGDASLWAINRDNPAHQNRLILYRRNLGFCAPRGQGRAQRLRAGRIERIVAQFLQAYIRIC